MLSVWNMSWCAALEADLSANQTGMAGAAKEDGREIASNITSFCSQQEDHEKASSIHRRSSQIIAVYFVPPSMAILDCFEVSYFIPTLAWTVWP